MIREVNLTAARSLSPIFDEAVRRAHPVVIVRGRRERGLLLAHDTMLRVLAPCQFHVDILPEEGGGFTLWLNELSIGGSGRSLQDDSCPLAMPPRLGQVREFCVKQGYRETRTDHFHYPRVPPDRSSSSTMVAMGIDGEEVPRQMWTMVWRRQLRLSSEEEFWRGLL